MLSIVTTFGGPFGCGISEGVGFVATTTVLLGGVTIMVLGAAVEDDDVISASATLLPVLASGALRAAWAPFSKYVPCEGTNVAEPSE